MNQRDDAEHGDRLHRFLERLALVALVLAGIGVLVGALVPRTSFPVSGDRLGREIGESDAEYVARADQTLSNAERGLDGGNNPRWSLVTFRAPVDAEQAAAALSAPSLRVAQVYVTALHDAHQGLSTGPQATGEPARGETRADVFRRAMDHARRLTVEASPQPTPPDGSSAAAPEDAGVLCVVVRADPRVLRGLRGDPAVLAVEALPADARDGAFDVVPVIPGE